MHVYFHIFCILCTCVFLYLCDLCTFAFVYLWLVCTIVHSYLYICVNCVFVYLCTRLCAVQGIADIAGLFSSLLNQPLKTSNTALQARDTRAELVSLPDPLPPQEVGGWYEKRNLQNLEDALRKIHFAKIQFGNWNPKAVGHSVQKIYPVVPRTLCTGPETEWKYESVTGLWRLYSGSWKLYSGSWRLYSEDLKIQKVCSTNTDWFFK